MDEIVWDLKQGNVDLAEINLLNKIQSMVLSADVSQEAYHIKNFDQSIKFILDATVNFDTKHGNGTPGEYHDFAFGNRHLISKLQHKFEFAKLLDQTRQFMLELELPLANRSPGLPLIRQKLIKQVEEVGDKIYKF